MTRHFTFLASAALFCATVPGIAFSQASSFSDTDKSFLKNITEDNLGEIKMAELAVKTSKNPDVQKFAHKMITDHRALIVGSKPVAMKAGVTPPTSTSAMAEADYLKLKVLSGDTFDKSYVKTMVSDHQDDLNKLKQEHDGTQNADMKKLTEHANTVVEGHKKMIDAIAGKMGVA